MFSFGFSFVIMKGQMDMFCAVAEAHTSHLENILTSNPVQRKSNTLQFVK